MRLKAHTDIEAPVERVFERVSDFAAFERLALRRGARVVRTDDLDEPGPGMSWLVTAPVRGRRRQLEIELVEWLPPERMRFAARTAGYAATTEVGLSRIGPQRTRLALDVDIRSRSLAARMVLHALRLARRSIMRRLRRALRRFGKAVAAGAPIA